MTPAEFDAVVHAAIDELPAEFRAAFNNIDLLILDTPSEQLGFDADDLLGLYTGTPLTERPAVMAGDEPDIIYVFREPHLALGLSRVELKHEIRTTVLHEVAHYFGIDDDRLTELGWD